jgi:tetratricopeptide (TPR) repeat protein
MNPRVVPAAIALLLLTHWAPGAEGQEPLRVDSGSSAAASASERLARAKSLFRKGIALLEAGDLERALDLFLQSREVVPSIPNTIDAALCLDRLGRQDEALELWEQVLVDFQDDLDAASRASVAASISAAQRRVGTIEIASNVGGDISIDGRPKGPWPRKTPLRATEGVHQLRIEREGYEAFDARVDVRAGSTLRVEAELAKKVPPVAVPSRGLFVAEVFGGAALGGTLNGDAEATCQARCSKHVVAGGLAGARVGYLFGRDRGFAVELSGGYIAVRASVSRSAIAHYEAKNPLTAPQAFTARYGLDDDLSLRGAFLGAGISHRARLGRPRSLLAFLVTRATIGMVVAASTDPITGSVTVAGSAAPVAVSDADQLLRSTPVFVLPALGVEVAWRAFRASLSVGEAFFPLNGPRFGHAEVGPVPSCPPAGSGATPGCVPNSTLVASERAYGPFALFVPQVSMGVAF